MGFFDFLKGMVDSAVDNIERKTGQELRRVNEWEKKNGSTNKSQAYREKLYDNYDKIDSYNEKHR